MVYQRRREQPDCLQYHRLKRPKRDMGQTQKYLYQNRPRNSVLNLTRAAPPL